ncbi:hypothetical protein ACFL6S_37450 [Candidatus Poribacteria bacterium]
MFRKVILAIICAILVCQLFGFLGEAAAQSVERLDKVESFWVQLWNWLKDHTFLFSIVLVSSLTIFSTIMATLKRDNLLKSLAGHLVTIELQSGPRYRGRLRVESEGVEVVAEKADEGPEKVSYLLRKDEYKNIHALVRYHDFLTDREKEQREAEVDKVYHPSIGMRLRRKLRNIVNEMKRVGTEAFSIVFGKISESFNIGGRKYSTEVEKAGEEAITYATDAAYDALIDRLIGTRIVAWVNKDLEYIGVLKDYTSQFIELLDVDYGNSWRISMERGHKTRHQRGLILRKDGNDIVIQSKSPFKVRLKNIYWGGDKPNAKREKINKTIEPFGELRFNLMPPALEVGVASFNKLRLPQNYHYQAYKKIDLDFSSVRVADIVMLKTRGIIRHRTEKYDPKLLDFGALADALLTSKDGELALEGAPDSMPLTVHNGYLTNLPQERMDFAELDGQLSKRWEVDRSYANLDKKLRPISRHYFLRLLPLRKARKILALLALMIKMNSDENRGKDPILAYHVAFALCSANRRRKRRSLEQEVLIKKKRRPTKLLFANFPRLRLPRLRRATPAPTEE